MLTHAITRSIVLIAALAAWILPGTALAVPHATARLDGAQEVPPVVTPAKGTASLSLNHARTELTFDITVQGLSSPMTLAHFHRSPAGVNGPVVRTITPDFNGNTATGVWRATDGEPLTPALVAELLAGNIYMNVHTANHGGGEIRGQVDVIAGLHAKASLTGAQENPPVPSTATGTGVFTLTDAGLAFDVTVEGLTGPIVLAHFHNAATGVNGPVVRTITADFAGGNTATGIWTKNDAEPLTPTLIAEILAGRIYVNVHTAMHGGGEIRGQVLLQNSSGHTARLDGAQEVPPVATPAKGTASCTLNDLGTALRFNITVQGLSSPITLAHFHNAPAGVNGGVVRTITPNFIGNTASGDWRATDAEPLTPALVNELLAGRIYLNVHTANNGGGEIRGQVLLTTGIGRTATLDGGEEVPPVATTATGTGSCVLTGAGIVFDVTVEGLSTAMTLAHFHNAPAGVNGGVVRTITASFGGGSTATGTWMATDGEPLTPTRIGEFVAGNHYLNVHTVMHGGGEIRGQLSRVSVVGIAQSESAPIRSLLAQNYPNPFNPTTTIRYELATSEHVTLGLYDVAGREVARLVDEVQSGPQAFDLDARDLPSGIYFYRIVTPSFTDTRKLVLTK
jgi:hypothetical protein